MLITYFFTFLCIRDGELFQSHMCDYEVNKDCIATINDLENFGFYAIRLGKDDSFCFHRSGGVGEYLSAGADGGVWYPTHCLTWEVFQLKEGYRPFQVEYVPESSTIPKLIHQTDGTEIPREQFLENIRELKENNGEYSYNYYNEKDIHDFIYENFGWKTLDLYLRVNRRYGGARADLFRYLCIYKYGGIYLDIKSGCKKPFRDILGDDTRMVLSHWSPAMPGECAGWGHLPEIDYVPEGEIQQWFIISRAGNPLMERVINQVFSNVELYCQKLHGCGHLGTLRVTGPIPYTRVLKSYGTDTTTRYVDSFDRGIIYKNLESYKKVHDYTQQDTPLIL